MSFELPKLKYAHDALEPHIDEKTMTIHHGKHHQGYTNKLNAAIEGTDLEGKTIENILTNLEMSNTAVRNNGGGSLQTVVDIVGASIIDAEVVLLARRPLVVVVELLTVERKDGKDGL